MARARCHEALRESLASSWAVKQPDPTADLKVVFADGEVLAHRVLLAAHSEFLRDLLAEPGRDCLVFPELGLAEGRLALQALYCGTAPITRQSALSLGSVERCLRAFQAVGLLQEYSVQIAPPLPLSTFRSTRPAPHRAPRSPLSSRHNPPCLPARPVTPSHSRPVSPLPPGPAQSISSLPPAQLISPRQPPRPASPPPPGPAQPQPPRPARYKTRQRSPAKQPDRNLCNRPQFTECQCCDDID